jgi:hypothetical protein
MFVIWMLLVAESYVGVPDPVLDSTKVQVATYAVVGAVIVLGRLIAI